MIEYPEDDFDWSKDYQLKEKNMDNKYSFGGSLLKTVVRVVLLLAPVVVPLLPTGWMNLTLGAAFILVFDWLKAKYTSL